MAYGQTGSVNKKITSLRQNWSKANDPMPNKTISFLGNVDLFKTNLKSQCLIFDWF